MQSSKSRYVKRIPFVKIRYAKGVPYPLPWVAPFTLVSLVTTVETVDGKRRRSIFCGVSSLFLFLPEWGEGGAGVGGGEEV